MSARRLALALVVALGCAALIAQFAPAGAAGKRPVSARLAPNDPPIGVTLDTLGADGAIVIDGTGYGGSGEESRLAYVVLERTTRAVVESGNVIGDGEGISTLAEKVKQFSSPSNALRYVMIISGRKSPPPGNAGSFFALLRRLGVPLLSPSQVEDLDRRGPFSIIGIPGAPAGAATVRIPGRPDPEQPSGAITGYLAKSAATSIDGSPVYDYVSPQHPAFDTRAPGSDATTNVMTLGGKAYTAKLVGADTAGFHVVTFDSLTLRVLVNEAIATNSTSPQTDRPVQAKVANMLKTWLESPSAQSGPAQPDITVLVQTIGKPKAAGPEWQGIVDQLARLGANRQLVNALDGTTEYALVGGINSPVPPAEASTAYDHGPYPAPNYPPARLVGALDRTRSSTFEPIVSSTPTAQNPAGGVNLGLIKVAYQRLQSWPELAPGEPRDQASAAQAFICDKLNFCQASNSCPDVRSCYWQKYGADWGLKHSILAALGYPGTDKGFSERTFVAVKAQLLREIAAVANVEDYLSKLQAPFDRSATRGYVDLQAIGKKIYDAVQPPPIDNSTSSTLNLISKIAKLGEVAPPPGGNVASGLSAAFELGAFLSDKQGQPILGSEIQVKTSELATQLLDRFDLARKELAGIGQLIVSDYGKLTDANTQVDSDWSLPADPTVASDALRTATQQWFYEALVPVAYRYLIRGNAFNAKALDCGDSSAAGWPHQPDQDQMQATVGYNTNGKPITAVFFFTKGIYGGSSPPGGVFDNLFTPKPPTGNGLGIEKLTFFTPSVFNGQIQHAVNHTKSCELGWLPNWR
jgi:hypothetical protein